MTDPIIPRRPCMQDIFGWTTPACWDRIRKEMPEHPLRWWVLRIVAELEELHRQREAAERGPTVLPRHPQED